MKKKDTVIPAEYGFLPSVNSHQHLSDVTGLCLGLALWGVVVWLAL